ncbi:conserved hypothetical protein [Rhodopseudomonas palustris BisB18]|uniref:Uncharacterized protein n=2 Tax=Rhodopseudomonas palustris TaxID=1076 RepID=Q217U3_RHOPB
MFRPRSAMAVSSKGVALRLLTGALLTATLCGCSGGDFGRTREDMRSDDMHRWLGTEVTGSVGLRASEFQLTDNERSLRDFAYPLIEPPHSRPAWKSVFGDYSAIASPWRQTPVFDRTAYGRMLIDEPHRSHTSRYAQLMDDVRNDLLRLDPFQSSGAKVVELDKKRNASLKFISDLSARERADAVARMEENALIVQWVQQSLHRRVASYRWALERLVLQAPDGLAADADRLINELEANANAPSAWGPQQRGVGVALSVRG